MRRAVPCWIASVVSLALLVSMVPQTSEAAWTQTNGPRGGSIRSFVTAPNGTGGTSLFAGAVRAWRTDDRGSTWTHLSGGPDDPNAFSLLAVPNGSGGHDLFMGTANGIYRSSNLGASWSPSGNGVPSNLSIYALASGPNGSGGTNLYAGTFLGNAFRSSDQGATWTAINSGLPLNQANVNALVTTASGTILAGTMNGIYRSTNFGASWTRVTTNYGFSFAKHGSTLYAGTSQGVFRSTNDGATWTAANTGMGFSWIYAMTAIPNGSGVTLFAGAGGVLRSTDNGATWTPASNGLTSIGVYALTTAPNASGGTDLFAGTAEGIFRSADNGDTWTNESFISSIPQELQVTPSGSILAATERDVFRSTDAGETWTDTQLNSQMLDFAVHPNGTLFAGGALIGIFKSTNDGATWVDTNNDISDIEVNSVAVVPNGSGGTHVIVGDYSGIFVSTNDGGSWQSVEPTAMPLDYAVTPSAVFAGGFGGVLRSTDGGLTWANTPISGTAQAMAATANGANVFAGGDPFGVYRSTNNGASWTLVNSGLTDLRITSLLSPDGTQLFAAGAGGVYLTKDQGDHWSSVSTGLTTGVQSLALSADGATLLAGTSGYGVWKRPLSEMLGTVDVPRSLPTGMALRANHPNPFSTGTTLHFSLPREAHVRLVVHDVTGRTVRVLVNGLRGAGNQQAVWDGRDERGSRVSPGVYVTRLDVGGVSLTRKMTLLH